MKRHHYGISAVVPQTSFCGDTSGGIARFRLLSQANKLVVLVSISKDYLLSPSHFLSPYLSNKTNVITDVVVDNNFLRYFTNCFNEYRRGY